MNCHSGCTLRRLIRPSHKLHITQIRFGSCSYKAFWTLWIRFGSYSCAAFWILGPFITRVRLIVNLNRHSIILWASEISFSMSLFTLLHCYTLSLKCLYIQYMLRRLLYLHVFLYFQDVFSSSLLFLEHPCWKQWGAICTSVNIKCSSRIRGCQCLLPRCLILCRSGSTSGVFNSFSVQSIA